MSRLAEELEALQVRLHLNPTNHYLRVEIAAGRRTLRRLARSRRVEPLTEILARLAAGELTPDQAGTAISRDGAVASQLARAIDLQGAQTGDVQIGTVAGGNVYHIHYGGPREREH